MMQPLCQLTAFMTALKKRQSGDKNILAEKITDLLHGNLIGSKWFAINELNSTP